jgi:hypothetical protein
VKHPKTVSEKTVFLLELESANNFCHCEGVKRSGTTAAISILSKDCFAGARNDKKKILITTNLIVIARE